MITTFLVGSVVALGAVMGLHWIDTWLYRRAQAERRAALLASLGKAPSAPGTMRRRYSDLTEPGDSGDEGGFPWHDRDAA